MTLLIQTAARRRVRAYPWTPIGWNTIPTYDGGGATIHPSVVDMVGLTGSTWNGYRWWMANTPYFNNDNRLENPSIFASHDGVTWVVPAGLTNPIQDAPPVPQWNADTEIAWDPDAGRMVLYWLTSGTEGGFFRATSVDGVNWTKHGKASATAPGLLGRSPSLVRVAAGDWRLFAYTNRVAMYTATDPLGPWSGRVELSRPGYDLAGWHGDIQLIDGVWYAAHSLAAAAGENQVVLSVQDGPTMGWWTTAMVLPWESYRPTICDGRVPGTIDLWGGTYSSEVPGGCGTRSTTIPKSAWLDARVNS